MSPQVTAKSSMLSSTSMPKEHRQSVRDASIAFEQQLDSEVLSSNSSQEFVLVGGDFVAWQLKGHGDFVRRAVV